MTPHHPLHQVVVVGGGYIGAEAAAALSQHPGLRVTVVVPEAHLMARVMPPAVAEVYETCAGRRAGGRRARLALACWRLLVRAQAACGPHSARCRARAAHPPTPAPAPRPPPSFYASKGITLVKGATAAGFSAGADGRVRSGGAGADARDCVPLQRPRAAS